MKTPENIIETYSSALKQDVGLGLSIQECKDFVHSVVTECVILKPDLFTKEQVIELMKRAWRDSSKAEFDRILEGGDEEIAATDFEYWLEQEKPFDTK